MLLAGCAAPARAPQTAASVRVARAGSASPPLSVSAPGEVDRDADADTKADGEDGEDGDWLTACKDGSPEHQAATTALDGLTTAIKALPLNADPKPLASRIADLLEDTCFAAGGADLFAADDVDSALALKTFWEAGGEYWLSSRLGWGKPSDRWLTQAPSVRRSLTTDNAKHPLAPMLCPAAPGTCGRETAGWMVRADLAMRAHARIERASFLDMSPMLPMPMTYDSCKEKAAASKAATAFETFSDCMAETPLRQDALPLGTFRAPKDGWLVLRGRRGHHGWCNELRAYHLGTGAAYVAATCGGMFSPQQSGVSVETGSIPVEALREAAWMIFLSEAAERSILLAGEGRYIPDTITIRSRERGRGLGFSIGSSSGRTTLTYQWVRNGKSSATGTARWPDADEGAHQHATELLAIAEAGFTRGCAPVPLPAIPWAARSDMATRIGDPKGYFPAYDGDDFAALEQEIAKVGAQRKPCASP